MCDLSLTDTNITPTLSSESDRLRLFPSVYVLFLSSQLFILSLKNSAVYA